MFLTVSDPIGKAARELVTALNISAGGALIACQRPYPTKIRIVMEIPNPPFLPDSQGTVPIQIEAETVRVHAEDGVTLLGIQFVTPIATC